MRASVSRLQLELTTLRSKYDKELIAKNEELEDLRRRLNARIAELEDALEQARSRAAKFEKDKTRLAIEIREITVELESATMAAQDLGKRLKQSENLNAELQRRVDELTHDLGNANNDNARLNAELARLKILVTDLGDKNDQLT